MFGKRFLAVVSKVVKTPVPTNRWVVHLVFSDGRQFSVSPRHPTADGRRVSDLTVGEIYGGARIAKINLSTTADASPTISCLPVKPESIGPIASCSATLLNPPLDRIFYQRFFHKLFNPQSADLAGPKFKFSQSKWAGQFRL